MILRRNVGRAEARFRSPSVAYVCGLCGSDRNRIGVRRGDPFDLGGLPGCSFLIKRIIALVRAGENEGIRKRVDNGGPMLLLRLLPLPLARVFLSRARMNKRGRGRSRSRSIGPP